MNIDECHQYDKSDNIEELLNIESKKINVSIEGVGKDYDDDRDEKAKMEEGAEQAILHDTDRFEFTVNVIKQCTNCVTIEWLPIENTDVYEIEKFHRRRGWQQVGWTSNNRAIIENLDENFTYRLRIKALIYQCEPRAYVMQKVSQDIMATTLAAQPTTLCLHRAIKKGQQFLVKRILRKRPSLIEYPAPNGYLPLANAIAFGDNSVVDALLTAGANVHIGNTQNGRTPLHMAFYYGRFSVARILLNKKAKLEACDANGMTACHFAIDANQFEMLRFALENGANLEAADACGWTLLLRAVVMFADVAMLQLLITHGANRRAVDRLGQSCMDLARLYDHKAASKYFEHLHGSAQNKLNNNSIQTK